MSARASTSDRAAGAIALMIDSLTTHGGHAQPAPHKPLLLMWAIARRRDGAADRLFTYDEAHEPVANLLRLDGRTPRPWYPFVRLRHEPFWDFIGQVQLNDSDDVNNAKVLLGSGVKAGFRVEYDDVLLDRERADAVMAHIGARWLDPALASATARRLDSLIGMA